MAPKRTDTPVRCDRTNLDVALNLAAAGLYVLFVKGKASVTCAYQRRDHEIPASERLKIMTEFEADHGFEPVFIGSTRDAKKIREAFKANRGLVPAICGGPNGMVILDPDYKSDGSKDGPNKLNRFFVEHDIPDHPVTKTQSGGEHHFFADPLGEFSNASGKFKAELDTDVRGRAGYVVAPGAVMWNDGNVKRYTPLPGKDLLKWQMDNIEIPDAPYVFNEMAGSNREETKTKETQAAMQVDDAEIDFDPVLGRFDLEYLKAKDDEFRAACDGEIPDESQALWWIVRSLVREYGEELKPHHALAAVHLCAEGAGLFYVDKKRESGEYDDRSVARAYEKAFRDNVHESRIVDGAGFGAVDEEDGGPVKPRNSPVVMTSQLIDQIPEIDWLIEGLLPQIGVAALASDPNAGKTLAYLDVASRVALGKALCGREVMQGTTLVVAAEGHVGLHARVLAIAKAHGKVGNFGIIDMGQDSLFANPKRAVKRIVEAARETERASGQPIRLVVFDTLAMCGVGMDENSVQDMGIVLKTLGLVRDELKCLVLATHHTGKDKTRGMRGSTALLGNVDTALELEVSEKTKVVSLKVKKQRDGSKGQKLEFTIEGVDLGVNSRGKPVTSAVVRWKGDKVEGSGLGAVDEEDETLDQDEEILASGGEGPGRDEEEDRVRDDAATGRASRRGRPRKADVEAVMRRENRNALYEAVADAVKGMKPAEISLTQMRGRCAPLDALIDAAPKRLSQAIREEFGLNLPMTLDGIEATLLDDSRDRQMVFVNRGKTRNADWRFVLIAKPTKPTPHSSYHTPEDDDDI